MLVERQILGRLKLVLCVLRFVDGFEHDRTDAGFDSSQHACVVNEMVRRARNDRLAQDGPAELGHQCVRHGSSAYSTNWRLLHSIEMWCYPLSRTRNGTPMRARGSFLLRVVAALCALGSLAQAQTWPARSVTVVVPFAAGVTGDIVARRLVEHLSSALGQPFVVDNRAGAGGNIGGNAVAKAAPDGYALLLATTGPAANNKLTYKNMPYDPQRDLAPIVLMGKSPVIITAKLSLPAKDLKEFVAYAKANPGKVTAGYPGNGTFGHITGELLQQRAGMQFVQTHYRGSPAIINDILGEHIDIGMDS